MASDGAHDPARLLINIVPVMRARFTRLLAIVLLGTFSGPAIAVCGLWSASAADRHACCAGHGGRASPASVLECCAISEQSNDSTPAESLAAQPPLTLLRADVFPGAGWVLPSRVPVLTVFSASRHATLVPLYSSKSPS